MNKHNIADVLREFTDCSFNVNSNYCGLVEEHEISCFGKNNFFKIKVCVLGCDYSVSQGSRGYESSTLEQSLFIAIQDSLSRVIK